MFSSKFDFEKESKMRMFSRNLLLIAFLSVFSVQAATITSTATGGTWTTASTWVGGVVPGTGDTVIIATTGTGSVNISGTITQTAAGSITITNGAILTMSGGTITFGALTVNSGGTITIRRNTTILGTTTISGRINFGSTSNTTRTITFTGAVTLNSGAIWDETNAGANTKKDTYVIKNNFVNNATTFTPLTGSPHNFTGSGALSGSTMTAMPTATFTATYTNNGLLSCATLLTITTVTLTNNGTITAGTSLAGSGVLAQGATGVLNLGGASSLTTLTATASGNIVNYTGAAQTIHTGNYSVLNLSGSGIKTLLTGTTTIGSLTLSGTATITTVVNLSITNTLSVNAGCTFTTGATFTLGVGGVTTVAGSLVLGGSGVKTFTGDVLLNSGGVWNETTVSTINFGGNFTNNATTFTATTGGHNFTGATKTISGSTTTVIPIATFTGAYTINSIFTSATLLTVTGVSVTNNGTITASTSLTGTGGVVQGATGILNLGSTIGITTLNASTAGNIVNYIGAGQTGYVTTYSTLILSGSGTKTFATSPTITALLSMEGTALISIVPTYGSTAALRYNTSTARAAGIAWITPFVASGGIIIKNTGAITTPGVVQIGNNTNVPLNISSGATLTPGSNLIIFHGDFINNGTLTSGSGGMTIAGTAATQSIDDFTTTGAVTFTKSSGTATLVGNIKGGALTINGGSSGTLNLGVGLIHTFTGIVTLTGGVLNGGSSTLNENAVSATAWNGTASVFVPASGTINFGASGAQTIAANSSFYNLGFSGSGIKTLSSATAINNNFSISGTSVANLGTGLTHTAISLTLGGVSQVIGTWGSTVSTALNKNATWFGSSATGTLNVSCVAPSAPISGGNQTICSGATIPVLTVSVSAGQLVDWYSQPSGGTLLLSNSTSYTPSGSGTFYAETRVTASGCISATRTSVKLTVNTNPAALLLTGNTVCVSPGGNGTIVSTTSATGINYQLYNSSNVAVQTPKAGIGSALTWSSLAVGTGYYVVGINSTTGCSSTSSSVNVATNPNPTALVLTGSTICVSPGDDGVITSTTSQFGMDYQLYDSSTTLIQASQSGTGAGLTWVDLNAGSGYYVKGTNVSTGCVSSNSNSVTISTLANPLALVLTGSTICASPGGNGTITSTTSVIGVDYQLNDSLGNDIGGVVSGTGSGLAFTGVPAGTGYYVDGESTTTGCLSASSNAVDVLTTPNPTNKAVSVSSASVCIGTGANIIVSGSLATESYQLRNDSTNANIGTAITGNGSVLNLASGNLTVATTFNVLATTIATGCTTEMTTTPTITVNPNNTIGSASSTPTLCVNTLLTPITHVSTRATGIGTATGLPTGVTASWATNVLTISGTPTTSGTFNYSIPLTGGCGSVNATGTITVNPNLPASVSIAATATTICSGTSVTFTATPTNGGSTPSYQWKLNGSNVGTNSATYTTSTLSNGNTVSVVMTSNASPCMTGSPATSNVLTMTVNALPSATIVSNNGPSMCAGSSVVFTVTGTSDATITYNLNGGSNATATLSAGLATITVNGATTTQMLNLVSVSNGCTALIGASSTVSIETTIWNGSIWDNGLPNSSKSVVFTGDYTMTSDFSACSISVSNNAVVSVDSGKNVSLNGSIIVASGSSFILNTNANLYQSNASAVNTGNIIVKRDSNPLIRLDYTMWSSPVAGQKLLAFSPLTSIAPTVRFYTYNTTTNSYNSISSPSTTDFATGKGYLIRLPYNHPTAPAVWTGAFIGVPNNGTKTVALTNVDETHQYNAVGNPYPSPISVSQFLLDNASNIEPTIYFWRKTNNATKPSYCTWNCASQTFISNGEAFSANPNGVIQTGQGFIVEAKGSATSLEFNNGQRVVNNTNHFFKTTSSSATTTTESHRIWLNLTGVATEYSQAVVGYFTNATQGADDYDSKLFNDGSITLSTKIGVDDYVIQSRPTPFDASDIVPLNYKVTTPGTYTFTIDHVDGLFTAGAQEVYLKDNLDGSYHNITTTPYSFASAAGTFSNRFELVYQNLLSTNQTSFTANSIVVYHQQNDVVINTGSTSMSSVKVYDIRGRLLIEKKDVNVSETRINVGTTNQVLLVQVTTTEGLKAIKKVVN